MYLAGEIRSFERAAVATKAVLRHEVSTSTIRRLAKEVGLEIAEDDDVVESDKEIVVPEAAVVSCDGGRIRTRQAGGGRGVRLSGERGWRETKNASFERMSLNNKHVPGEDPCPELPTSFRSAKKVANIAEKGVPNVEQPAEETPSRVKYEGPNRVLRTVRSSMVSSDEFGPMMQHEAERRRFYEAPLRVFLGDGLNWNWTIWKKHFPTFIPVLDFIHAIQYIFAAAMAMAANEQEGWALYLKLVTWCWQGKVDQVIEEIKSVCETRGIDWTNKHPSETDKPLVDAIRYLTNNRERMDYPRYRKLGLPVTSAPMESLIKQINLRVKGTEMFWDDPDGAEAILALRAAVVSEDGRLRDYLARRPGSPFTRRSTSTLAA